MSFPIPNCFFLTINLKGQFTVLSGMTNTNSPSPITVGGTATTGLLLGTSSNPNNNLNEPTNIAIGRGSISNIFNLPITGSPNLGANNLAIGINALQNSGVDYRNIGIGNYALQNLKSPVSGMAFNIAIGHYALALATTGTNFSGSNTYQNIVIWDQAMEKSYQSTTLNTNNSQNIAIGYRVLRYNVNQWNIGIGNENLVNNSTGYGNVSIGVSSLTNNTTGMVNTVLGHTAMSNNVGGGANVAVGNQSLNTNINGGSNTGIGTEALKISTGYNNCALGRSALNLLSSGDNNIGIGYYANVFSSTGSNQLSIQNVIYGINMTSGLGNGNIGIGVVPSGTLAKLEVGGTLKINSVPTTTNANTSKLFLWVDPITNVINNEYINPIGNGGVTSSCSTQYTIPRVAANGNSGLECSQIYDDGTSVGINKTSLFGYTSGAQLTLGSPTPPTYFKLAVNGWTSSTAFVALSDQRLKKNIKKIENPLDKISKINGYTYSWNKDFKSNRQLDENKQAGFLAQEIEKVLPEAVVKAEDGIYGINYNAILPLLSEGIKEQQSEIESLKSKIDILEKKLSQINNNSEIVKINNSEYFTIKPNPITQESIVNYKITQKNSKNQFVIYDLQGKMLKQISISNFQKEGQFVMSKKEFSTGVYVLSLISNNESIQSKQFIVLD